MSEFENPQPSEEARTKRAQTAGQNPDDEAIFNLADWGMEKHFLIHSGKRAMRAAGGWFRVIARDNDTRAISKLHFLASELVKSRGDQFQAVETEALKVAYYASPDARGFVSDKPVPKTWKLERTPLGQKVLDALRVDYHALRAEYPNHRMSVIYEAFVKVTAALPDFMVNGFVDVHSPERLETERTMEFIAAKLNVLVDFLRLRWRAVSEEYANFCRSPIENYNGFFDDIDMLFTDQKKLMILHADLHEKPASDAGDAPKHGALPTLPFSADISPKEMAEEIETSRPEDLTDSQLVARLTLMQKARTAFQREVNRRFKKRLLGYGWCLEFGERRAWHYHYLIFLKPLGKEEDDIELVDSLGAFWLGLKSGGDYYNVNEHKEDHKYLAAGLVDTRDFKVRQGMKYKVCYMTLAGLFVQTLLPEASRGFGRGGFKKGLELTRSAWRQSATWQAVRRLFTWI